MLRGCWIVAGLWGVLACGSSEDARPGDVPGAAGGAGGGGATTATSTGGAAEGGGGAGGVGGALPMGLIDLNDVTILLPFPSNATLDQQLWLFPSEGREGPGVPPAFADELPPLQGDLFNVWPATVVTAVRFDPCARAAPDGPCEAQLRLVAQPVFTGGGEPTMPDDSAGHLFYRLDPADVDAVVADLLEVKALSPVDTSGPLRVHPGLATATMDSAVGERLRALIVTHCTEAALTRITTNTFAMDNWGFLRFDVVDEELVLTELPGMVVTDTSQAWIRQAQQNDLTDPSGIITPAPSDDFSYFLASGNYAGGAPVDPPAASEAADVLVRIENPREVLVDQGDCVSCHLATPARLFARRNGVDFAGREGAYEPPPGIDTTLVLAPELDGNLSATIQLGYHLQRVGGETPYVLPSISARVVHETAEVVAELRGRR